MKPFQPICLWCDTPLMLDEEIAAGVCMTCWSCGADDGQPPLGITCEQWWKLQAFKRQVAASRDER